MFKKMFNIIFNLFGRNHQKVNPFSGRLSGFLDSKDFENVKVLNSYMTLFCVVLFVLGLWSSYNTKTEYSLKQFYPSDHPILMKEKKVLSSFEKIIFFTFFLLFL